MSAPDGLSVTSGIRWDERVPSIAQSMFQTMLEQGPGVVYLHDIK
jgi:hypothetical protein